MDKSSTARRGASKQALRERVWALLTRRRLGRFPLPLDDRIPNFAGADEAAERLAATAEWREARVLKCNPDAPQRPVRLRALREGKEVYVAVPRLAAARCFLRLDPRRLGAGRLAAAATIGGAAALGVAVAPRELPRIDLVVAGSVAVNRRGARVGKGGGYSDLEFALAAELGAVDARTTICITAPSGCGSGRSPRASGRREQMSHHPGRGARRTRHTCPGRIGSWSPAARSMCRSTTSRPMSMNRDPDASC